MSDVKQVGITWYPSPEAVHRAYWQPMAESEGMTYEVLIAEGMTCAFDQFGNMVEMTHDEEMAALRSMGAWGFADTKLRHIHAWAAPETPREQVMRLLAHEIGHLTGEPCKDELQEEFRAETFGAVAAMAFSMLPLPAM